MSGRFEVIFPLVMEWDNSFSITFEACAGERMVFSDGIYYLEGDNGSGKTTLAKVLSRCMGLEFRRVQFTSDMLPGDILENGVDGDGDGFGDGIGHLGGVAELAKSAMQKGGA